MASGGLGLVDNLAVRQCLLEFLYAFVGDLSIVEAELFELGQSFQVLQAGVGDSGAIQGQPVKPGQSFQVYQAGVGDLGVDEDQHLKCITKYKEQATKSCQ